MTMNDRKLQRIMFGNTVSGLKDPKTYRTATLVFSSNGEESKREITYPAGDGLILYLLRRIEKLEHSKKP